MRFASTLLLLSALCFATTGCIVIGASGSSSSSSISVKLTDRDYPPRPADHPIDVYLAPFGELKNRLGNLPNQKLHEDKPEDAIHLIQINIKQSGDDDFPSLKSLIKDLVKDARNEGGDAIYIKGMSTTTILDETHNEYTLLFVRYPDKE